MIQLLEKDKTGIVLWSIDISKDLLAKIKKMIIDHTNKTNKDI